MQNCEGHVYKAAGICSLGLIIVGIICILPANRIKQEQSVSSFCLISNSCIDCKLHTTYHFKKKFISRQPSVLVSVRDGGL